ncbi:MAG: hypothetical protein ACI9FB_002658 [Candidatus Azotimanducaceae bacterium]|jgi:hypothetical protein
MRNDNHPSVKLNFQLVRYHAEELMEQIALLEAQIETNLDQKNPIKHLSNMILERQRYLSEYIEIAKSSSIRKTQR